jgi:hypothetical protein
MFKLICMYFLTRHIITFVIMAFLLTVSMGCSISMANSGAPVVYRYEDPATGTMVNYVGIPGGPVVYSELGPGGIKSVTSVNAGGPVVYSDLGQGSITGVSYVSPGGPVVYSTIGPGSINRVSHVSPGEPVVISITASGV